MRPQAYLAFETGGTKLIAAVAGADGRLIETAMIERVHHHTAQDSLPRLLDLGQTLIDKFRAQDYEFLAVGFGYGGQFDRAAQRPMQCFHEIGWEDLDAKAAVKQRYGLPVAMENDCKLAALAEAQLGAGRAGQTVFYITIGTGIGGGIVRNGRILDLGDKGEAEIGHMTIDPSGALSCACGKSGCLEAYCSGPGLVDLTKHLARGAAGGHALARQALNDPSFNSKTLFAAWAAGDDFAAQAVNAAAGHLGFALGAMIQLINPDVVVLGGGVATGNAGFIDLIAAATEARVMPNLRGRARFTPTELREQVVSQGAALLARQLVPAPHAPR
jgi:glucokinase